MKEKDRGREKIIRRYPICDYIQRSRIGDRSSILPEGETHIVFKNKNFFPVWMHSDSIHLDTSDKWSNIDF